MTGLEIALAGYLAFGQLIPEGQQEIVKYGGLQVIHADGAVTLRLKETGRRQVAEPDGRHIAISLEDEAYPFAVTRHVKEWSDCGVVETWVEVRHDEPEPVKLLRADSFAAALAVTNAPVRVLSLNGGWASEANVRETELALGQTLSLTSRHGTRDAWESNAAMMVSFGTDVDETCGQVLGLALEWTGTTDRRVSRFCDDRWAKEHTEVFVGIDMTTGPYTLDPGVTFVTPRAALVWSEEGRGEMSRQFHRWARNHVMPHGRELRPVLLNSWEGSYFTFTEATLTNMMNGVAEMGGEMFVLDDGWFGNGRFARDDGGRDKGDGYNGLGDWVVNTNKLPHGLGWLSAEAKRRGLGFGLWVEPEMVNVKSELAEAHPDWILREERRPLAVGRGGTQVVLDYANPAVRKGVWEMLDRAFGESAPLAYVKWDSNQNIVNPGSAYLAADRQPNLWYDYTIGLYDVLAKCRARRPDTLIQACASGGGHVDFGILRYCDEFWTSDCTDSLCRVFIQWGTSMFYPANAMACHVTASPNHQTGRRTPLKYRFDVAMTGRMGFELHPKDLSADELAFAKRAVADYKRIRPIVQQGDLYRLASPYENDFAALMYVNEDRSRAVVFVLGLDRTRSASALISLAGLDGLGLCDIREINCGVSQHTVKVDSGMLSIGLNGPFDSAVFQIDRCGKGR